MFATPTIFQVKEVGYYFRDYLYRSLSLPGMSIRAVCWCTEDKVLLGTQNSEIFEVDMKNSNNDAVAIMQGHREGELWGLTIHPTKLIAATAGDDGSVR